MVNVRLTPKAGRDQIDGVELLSDARPVLKVRVRAAPSEGEANAALVRLLATSLRLPASRIMVVAGASARLKRIRIEGDPTALSARMGTLVGQIR